VNGGRLINRASPKIPNNFNHEILLMWLKTTVQNGVVKKTTPSPGG
jgi:hypothetical protein